MVATHDPIRQQVDPGTRTYSGRTSPDEPAAYVAEIDEPAFADDDEPVRLVVRRVNHEADEI